MGLIEVVIAITIMLLVLVPVCYLLVNVISDTGGAVQKTAALSIAEQWIETLNSQGAPPVDPPVNNTPEVNTNIPEGTQSEGNITYTVSAYFQWADLSPGLTTPDLCTSTTLPPGSGPDGDRHLVRRQWLGDRLDDLGLPATGTSHRWLYRHPARGRPRRQPSGPSGRFATE